MHNYTLREAQGLWLYGLPKELADYLGSPDAEEYQLTLNSWVWFNYNGTFVPNIALVWMYALLLLGAVFCLFRHRFTPTAPHSALYRHLSTFWTKHVVLAATVGTRALQPTRILPKSGRWREWSKWTTIHLPTRGHSLVVAGFVVANVVILIAPYDVLRPNAFFPEATSFVQVSRYMADRSALLAFGLLPLLTILSSRNSPITTLTGASFTTLQIYHRWVARVTLFHVVAHALGYIVIIVGDGRGGGFWGHFKKTYWNWGWLAFVAGLVLCFGSLRRLRERAYELFLCVHVAANVVWIVGAFFHVWYLQKKHPLLIHVYAAFALWLLDRIIRRVRLFYLNYSLQRPGRGLGIRREVVAQGVLIGDEGHYIRLRVTLPRSWRGEGGPGTYVFLSFPTFKGMRQAHPFTIAWPMGMGIGDDGIGSSFVLEETTDEDSPSEWTERDDSTLLERRSESRLEKGSRLGEGESGGTEFELVIKVYGGFTRELQQKLLLGMRSDKEEGEEDAVESSPVPVSLVVQGPHGVQEVLDDFGVVLLVAGGTGIAAAIAHLARMERMREEGALEVDKVVVVWSVRDVGERSFPTFS
ncbi:hypothetical protein MNV49_002299 [Pseudohyphozyma bogoriensis]|nr:hypothetical protein MNV49_002299 [Pseudohyphozyma bogoriensis]